MKSTAGDNVPLTGVNPEVLWQQKQNAFNAADAVVREMEDAQLSKAPVFRKGIDLVRGFADQGKFTEAVQAFDALEPKINDENAKFQKSRGNSVQVLGDGASNGADKGPIKGAEAFQPSKGTPATGTKVTFKVSDKETADSDWKANIKVGSRTGQTDDANGVGQIEVEADGSSFLVQKDGFQDVTGKVDAKAGEQPVQLEKEPAFNPPPESKQPTLRKGANRADGWVEYLQKLLNKIFGPGTVPEDGDFDQKVEDAVKKFQGSTTPPCLKDGVVGNETWSMLRKGKREAVGVNKKGEEKGAEGRWATEKNDFVTYDSNSDELRMVVVSVGESPLDKFKATFRITSQDKKVKKQFLRGILGADDNFTDGFWPPAHRYRAADGGYLRQR